MIYKSTKHYGHNIGLSAVFRQPNADHSHCRFLHGYSLAFTFTFADVETKAEELETAEQTKKQNKVSAYKKLEMTDDEILAIDSTLEEYL